MQKKLAEKAKEQNHQKIILEDLENHKVVRLERKNKELLEDIALMEQNNRILEEKEAKRVAYFKFLSDKSAKQGDKFLETVLAQ